MCTSHHVYRAGEGNKKKNWQWLQNSHGDCITIAAYVSGLCEFQSHSSALLWPTLPWAWGAQAWGGMCESELLKGDFSCRQCLPGQQRQQHVSGTEAGLAPSHPQPGQEAPLLLTFQLQTFGRHFQPLSSRLAHQEKMATVPLTSLHPEANWAHLMVRALCTLWSTFTFTVWIGTGWIVLLMIKVLRDSKCLSYCSSTVEPLETL